MAASPGIFKDSVWVYGVLVGLSVKEALTRAVPGILEDWHNEQGWFHLQAGWRCFVFMIAVCRFYFGATLYFSQDPPAEQRTVYGVSAFMGFLHFVWFSAWAFAVNVPGDSPIFLCIMFLVLLWDLLWWATCFRRDPVKQVRTWAVVNAGTAIFAVAVFFGLKAAGVEAEYAELGTFAPLLLVSGIDLYGIVQGKNLFQDFLAPTPAPPPPPPVVA